MNTGNFKTETLQNNVKADLERAAQLLRSGQTVAFPTDTVYGLGANAFDESAVEKIYAAKGRPSEKPLIVLIYEKQQLFSLTSQISEAAHRLMDAFWPGPLTLVFPLKQNSVCTAVTRGNNTIGVRIPNHQTTLALLALANLPVAAPSANLSGNPSAVTVEQVLADLNGRISAIIVGSTCEFGEASTIVDVSGETPVILRQGAIKKEQIEQTLGYSVKAVNA